MEKTIIVMPVANEGETMNSIIDDILALHYDNLYLYPVIDKMSTDNTEDIIDAAEGRTNGLVHKIFYENSHGVASCYLYGFEQALNDGAERIIEMDGGGSHSPKEIPEFINALNAGYDCVWGSRFLGGGGIQHHPWYRRVLSHGGTWLSNLVLGTELKDMTSGFEAFQAHVLRKLDFTKFLSKGHMYQTEMRYYCRHYKCKEVPIHYIGGSSSLKFHSVIEAIDILFRFTRNEKCVFKETYKISGDA